MAKPNHNDALTVWGSNQIFAFSGLEGVTDFRGGLVAQSAPDGFIFRQPGLTKLFISKVTKAEFGVDWANLETEQGPIRLCFLDAHSVLISGTVLLEHLSDEYEYICLEQVDNYSILHAIGHDPIYPIPSMEDTQSLRRAWVRTHVGLVEGPFEDLGRKALQQMKGMVYAPEGQMRFRTATPDRYPHREIWLWDSVFHAIGYSHLDSDLAKDMLSAVMAAQLKSGQIGISFSPFSTRSHRSQPPLLAWGVAQLHAHSPDADWVASMLEPLRKYLAWFESHRRLVNLFGWVEDNGSLGSVCDESGMDNSPRFQDSAMLQAVDLCCYMAQEYRAMAKLDPEGDWACKADTLTKAIHEQLWNDDLEFYCDRNIATDQSTGIQAVTGFLPLILGNMPADRMKALIGALRDHDRFGCKLPVPSIAKSETGYAKDMWKGPVWINMNWMIAKGLVACGAPEVAAELRRCTLSAMQSVYRAKGSIFEYYDDDGEVTPPHLLRKGKTNTVIDPRHPSIHMVIHDYGWSATLALDWIVRGHP